MKYDVIITSQVISFLYSQYEMFNVQNSQISIKELARSLSIVESISENDEASEFLRFSTPFDFLMAEIENDETKKKITELVGKKEIQKLEDLEKMGEELGITKVLEDYENFVKKLEEKKSFKVKLKYKDVLFLYEEIEKSQKILPNLVKDLAPLYLQLEGIIEKHNNKEK